MLHRVAPALRAMCPVRAHVFVPVGGADATLVPSARHQAQSAIRLQLFVCLRPNPDGIVIVLSILSRKAGILAHCVFDCGRDIDVLLQGVRAVHIDRHE